MHLRELVTQPVNFLVCVMFVLLVGLVLTSVVLDNAGYPNPLTYMGGQLGLMFLNHTQR